MLSITNFKKQFGNFRALAIPQLDIPLGIHLFRGRNGSGKTTFFKSVAGLLPFEGNIKVHEIDQKKHPIAYRKQISYAEAEPVYPDFLTAHNLLHFVAQARQVPDEQWKVWVQQLQMEDLLDQTCGTYSSGMLKKLSLAMALTGNQSHILLDEPFTTLDAEAMRKLCELIQYQHNSRGISFLLSSHQEIDPLLLPITHYYTVTQKCIISQEQVCEQRGI